MAAVTVGRAVAGNLHASEVAGLIFAYIEILKQPGGITKERWACSAAMNSAPWRNGRLTAMWSA